MKSPISLSRRMCAAIAVALAAAGCSGSADNLPREPISGTVRFDGEPLESGTIQFHPTSQAEGMAAGGMIVDGRFDVPRAEGPVPGLYKVVIYALDDTPAVFPPPEDETAEDLLPGALKIPDPQSMPRRTIPARYNARTELTAEVKADQENTYTFNLEP